MDEVRIEEVLKYWFASLAETPEYFAERNKLWFGGGKKVDEYIRANFERDVEAAAAGKLGDWESTPRGALALIVLLDQFSLNLYRRQPKSFLQSEQAVPIARALIAKNWDMELKGAERVFVYLPFEHAENLPDQELAVEKFRALAEEFGNAKPWSGYFDYAVRHWKVVKRFGRFPDRNEVFGRESSPAEIAFLASDEAPF